LNDRQTGNDSLAIEPVQVIVEVAHSGHLIFNDKIYTQNFVHLVLAMGPAGIFTFDSPSFFVPLWLPLTNTRKVFIGAM
jgi:hypothetical protein